jgi:predicted transposase YbfD/YdcC
MASWRMFLFVQAKRKEENVRKNIVSTDIKMIKSIKIKTQKKVELFKTQPFSILLE